MILPKVRDPRFITIRRGGTLTDSDHRLLALWAAECAEHVLPLFESEQPADRRPRQAIEQTRAWARGEIKMSQARVAAGHANAAARDQSGAARHAAYAAGQAAAVAHVAAHELGAAAYAIKAARAAAPEGEGENAGRLECRWQRDQLPAAIRELVLDDQRLRNHICWSAFDCRSTFAECGLTQIEAGVVGETVETGALAAQDARRAWQVFEPYHAVIYFAPEARAAYTAAGLKGFWMGYFASRSAALG